MLRTPAPLIGALSAQSSAPISRSPRMMCNSDYEKFSITLAHNYVVGKAFENNALGTERSCCTRHGDQGNKRFLQQIKRCLHGAIEIYTETRLLHFISCSGLHCFVRRSFEDPDFGHQAGASRARIRRRSSSRSISVAVPAFPLRPAVLRLCSTAYLPSPFPVSPASAPGPSAGPLDGFVFSIRRR